MTPARKRSDEWKQVAEMLLAALVCGFGFSAALIKVLIWMGLAK